MKTPHLDYIRDNKIDVANADMPKRLKDAIGAWQDGFDEMSGLDTSEDGNAQLKEQWEDKLEKRSIKLAEDLNKHIPSPAAKEDPKPEEKKDPEKKEDKKDPEKKEAKKDPEKKDPVKKEDPQPEDKKDPEKKEDEEEDEEDLETKAINALNAMWPKATDGKLEMSEDDLKEAGIAMWSLCGFWSGQIGQYKFKSSFGSELWTITKEAKQEPAKAS